MGQGRGRRLCGGGLLFARWESTHGVCTESRGFWGRVVEPWLARSAFDGGRPVSRVPSSAHAVRFAPRNRAAEAPGSRGFRRGASIVSRLARSAFRRRWMCLGWKGVPSMKYAREVGTFLGSCCPLALPEIACGGTRFPGFQKVMAVPWLDEVPSMESAPGAGYLPRLMLFASLPEIACGGTRLPGLSEGGAVRVWGQRNTTVLWPFSMMRCSACHLTARASTTFSTSPPRAVRVSTVMVWSTRSTSCSMMGPSSSSAVT